MQAWQEHSFSGDWAKEVGLDVRGLRFARDVRRQLESITGPNGSHLLGLWPNPFVRFVAQPICVRFVANPIVRLVPYPIY